MNDVLERLAENMHGYLFAPFWLCGTAMNTSPNHVKLVLYVQNQTLIFDRSYTYIPVQQVV